jgi:hypothetical protein
MSTTITDRAAIVLQQIDAALALAEKATPGPWTTGNTCIGIPSVFGETKAVCLFQTRSNSESYTLPNAKDHATFIAASRTLLPASLRCLKTAIGALKAIYIAASNEADSEFALRTLANLCDQWEGTK